MKEEWLMPGAFIPVDLDTTKAMVDEIKRLIGVIGGMALQAAAPTQEHQINQLEKFKDHVLANADALGVVSDLPAAPVQEPVAWINAEKRTFEWNGPVLWNTPTVAVLNKIPLYTTPPAAQRQWVGLTDDEVIKCTPTWGALSKMLPEPSKPD